MNTVHPLLAIFWRLYFRMLLIGRSQDVRADSSLQLIRPRLRVVSSFESVNMLPLDTEWSTWYHQGHVFLLLDREWYCIDKIKSLSSLSKLQRFATYFPEHRFSVCLHSFLSTASFSRVQHDQWVLSGTGPGMA